MRSNKVSKLFTALEFLVVKPLVQQLLTSLCQNWATQLERLVLVQFTLIKQYTKVLKKRRRSTAWIRWTLLELLYGLWSTKNA